MIIISLSINGFLLRENEKGAPKWWRVLTAGWYLIKQGMVSRGWVNDQRTLNNKIFIVCWMILFGWLNLPHLVSIASSISLSLSYFILFHCRTFILRFFQETNKQTKKNASVSTFTFISALNTLFVYELEPVPLRTSIHSSFSHWFPTRDH